MKTEGDCLLVQSRSELDIVTSSAKSVFVYFYISSCITCKQLAPIFARLAKEFSQQKAIVFVKADGLGVFRKPAELASAGIKSFPSVQFFQHGELRDIFYGDR